MTSFIATSAVSIILISVTFFADDVQSACDSNGLRNNCINTVLAPVLPFLPGRNGTKVNSTLLDIGCTILSKAQSCVANTGCTSADSDYQQYWAGYNDALSYICSEKQEFLSYQNCLNLTGYNQRVQNCLNGKRLYDSTELCSLDKDQLSCLVSYLVTDNKCTTETIVGTYYTKLNKPALDLQTCGACKLTDPLSTCNVASLTTCVAMLSPVLPYLPGDRNEQKATSDLINYGCSLLANISLCVGVTGCTSADQSYQLYWAGQNAALSYICSARQDFISYQSCLDKPGYIQSMQACFVQSTDLCSTCNNQMSCLINYLVNTTHCTTESLVRNYFARLYQAELDVYTCGACKLSIGPTSTTTGGVSRIQSSVLLVAVGLIIKCIVGSSVR